MLFDVISTSTLFVSTLLGFLRGGTREFFLMSGWSIGFWAAYFHHEQARHFLEPYFPATLMQQAIIFLTTLSFFFAVGHVSRRFFQWLGLGLLDIYLGVLIGASRGVLLCYFLLAFLQITGFSSLLLDGSSKSLHYMEHGLQLIIPMVPLDYLEWVQWLQIE